MKGSTKDVVLDGKGCAQAECHLTFLLSAPLKNEDMPIQGSDGDEYERPL